MKQHIISPDDRLTQLECHLHHLLKWKELFLSSLGIAVAANTNLYQNGAYPLMLPQYVQSMPPTPMEDANVDSMASATFQPASDSAGTSNNEPSPQHTGVTNKILDIIQGYGQHLGNPQDEAVEGNWSGRAKFAPKVFGWVEQGTAVRMILPAFPWKSVNRVEKVLGALPDFGEELALARLNCLCKDIAKVYPPGAEVHVATDGLVFNDILGISDEDTWNYSVELMRMAAERGFTSVKLVRVMDILGLTTEGSEMTKETYMATVGEARKALDDQFGDDAYRKTRALMKDDEDTMRTYTGFIRFLRTDLRFSPILPAETTRNEYVRITKQVAMRMMSRAEAFTRIHTKLRGNYVRLSVHPSSGAVKLSIPLVPQKGEDGWPRTPWHCAIAVGVDGSYKTVHAVDATDTYNLIRRDGRPYFFREKSPLYDWDEDIVEFEHLYPGGLIAKPKPGLIERPKLSETNLRNLQILSGLQSSVQVQGFVGHEDGVVLPLTGKDPSLENELSKVDSMNL